MTVTFVRSTYNGTILTGKNVVYVHLETALDDLTLWT